MRVRSLRGSAAEERAHEFLLEDRARAPAQSCRVHQQEVERAREALIEALGTTGIEMRW